MLDEKYECRVRRLQNENNQLKARRKQAMLAMDRAQTDLVKIGPRRRDRYRVLLALGGDRAIYDLVWPLRRRARHSSREAARAHRQYLANEAQIEKIIHTGLRRSDPAYQLVLKRQEKNQLVLRSCGRMCELVDAAQKRIETAVVAAQPHFRDQAGRASADDDANEVSQLVRAVRRQTTSLNRAIRSFASVEPLNVRNLPTTFPGSEAGFDVRVRAFKTASVILNAIERKVGFILGVITEQAGTHEDERIRLFQRERARFK